MNHAGEKEFKTLTFVFAFGFIIVAIINIYLAAKLGNYESRLSEVEDRVNNLYYEVKSLKESLDVWYNETGKLIEWSGYVDSWLNATEDKIKKLELPSGWSFEDICWRILILENKVEALESEIELLKTP